MKFRISREDGRSDGQVIIDLVHDKAPGTLFKYDELSAILKVGTEREYPVASVRQIVINANNRLLRNHKRVLYNIRSVGYRLAEAARHNPLALMRKSRADTQVKRGLALLHNVRWDEMDANSRAAHEGTLVIMEAVYQQNRAMERRQSSIEDAIHALRRDVNDLKNKG